MRTKAKIGAWTLRRMSYSQYLQTKHWKGLRGFMRRRFKECQDCGRGGIASVSWRRRLSVRAWTFCDDVVFSLRAFVFAASWLATTGPLPSIIERRGVRENNAARYDQTLRTDECLAVTLPTVVRPCLELSARICWASNDPDNWLRPWLSWLKEDTTVLRKTIRFLPVR